MLQMLFISVKSILHNRFIIRMNLLDYRNQTMKKISRRLIRDFCLRARVRLKYMKSESIEYVTEFEGLKAYST